MVLSNAVGGRRAGLATPTFQTALRKNAEAACRQCNQTVQSFGHGLVTTLRQRRRQRPATLPPNQTPSARGVRDCRLACLRDHGLEDEPLAYLSRTARAASARAAIRRALESLGYLSVTRRRITPPFKSPLRVTIT